MNYFITGIGTNVGKTVVSAIITEALQADYWKPIQSGTIEGYDSEWVKSKITNSKTVIHPEAYSLKAPLSPHFAASLENVEIFLEQIKLPQTANHLIIEGAGGLLVPLNKKNYVIDIAKQFNCQVVLVISNYLGCINHTLLSIDYLIKNGYSIQSLVFNGDFDPEVKQAIVNYAPTISEISIPNIETINKEEIFKIASQIKI